MPLGTPHDSFLGPYPIRVDDFSTPRDGTRHTPALHLLSHVHADHVAGLSAKSFGSRVVCSIDTKHILLNEEPAAARIAFDKGETAEKTRPYAHLKIDSFPGGGRGVRKNYSRDLLRVLPLNTPVLFELSDGFEVTITLIDANHCPGSVMFLVEGPHGNFLHTGDVRADSTFLSSLSRNPCLQRYIPPSISFDSILSSGGKPLRTLDGIYLDTASLFSFKEVLSKDEACDGTVKLISQFPPSTRFFINSWTWGYEDILKAIGQAFNCQIHVDRYKYMIYSGVSDPFLKTLITREPGSTRFHACERWNRCDEVQPGAPHVVYVNPVTMSKVEWDLYLRATEASLERGVQVTSILCPLSRHSGLPELRKLVNLFKPKLVVPNSLDPSLCGLDWACMTTMFGDCMEKGGVEAIIADMWRANVDVVALARVDSRVATVTVEGCPAELQNLVGDGTENVARLWTGNSQTDQQDGIVVPEAANNFFRGAQTELDKFLAFKGIVKQADADSRRERSDVEGSDSDQAAEARAKAADTFFAPILSLSPSSSQLPMPSNAQVVTGSKVDVFQEFDAHREAPSSASPFLTFTNHKSSPTSPPLKNDLDVHASGILPFAISNPYGSRNESQPHERSSNGPDPRSAQKHVRVPQLPLASPSLTPSQRASFRVPTSVSRLHTPVPSNVVIVTEAVSTGRGSPPMLNLRKFLKRGSAVIGVSGPPSKRSKSKTTTTLHISRRDRKSPKDHPFRTGMERRTSREKEKQMEITMKLIRALPPDKIASTCRVKVGEGEIAERSVRPQMEALITAKGRAADVRTCGSPPFFPDGSQVIVDDSQRPSSSVDGQHTQAVDWERSREYEEVIRRQRKSGVLYPLLPRTEKSFAQSQSP